MSTNTRVLRLTQRAQCSGAQGLGVYLVRRSGCRWALERRLLAAASANLFFEDGLEHVRYIVGGQKKNTSQV